MAKRDRSKERSEAPWRAWVFKRRGLIPVPFIVWMFINSQPTTGSYLTAIALGVLGLAIRLWAAGYIKVYRVAEVQAPKLVTAGPYAHVRIPLYWGNFLVGLSIAVASSWGPAYPIFLVLFLFTYGSIIPLEEAHLLRAFGSAYRTYQQHVPRLRPRLAPYAKGEGTFQLEAAWVGERTTIFLFLFVMTLFALKLT